MNTLTLYRPRQAVVITMFDAVLLFYAYSSRIYDLLPRRPRGEVERSQLTQSGIVFAYNMKDSNIDRWTDGKTWTPSRQVEPFLVYREMCTKLPLEQCSTTTPEYTPAQSRLLDVALGALADHKVLGTNFNGGRVKPDGLIKRNISLSWKDEKYCLISYFTIADLISGSLVVPSKDPDLSPLWDVISADILLAVTKRAPQTSRLAYLPSGRPIYDGDDRPHHPPQIGDSAYLAVDSKPQHLPVVNKLPIENGWSVLRSASLTVDSISWLTCPVTSPLATSSPLSNHHSPSLLPSILPQASIRHCTTEKEHNPRYVPYARVSSERRAKQKQSQLGGRREDEVLGSHSQGSLAIPNRRSVVRSRSATVGCDEDCAHSPRPGWDPCSTNIGPFSDASDISSPGYLQSTFSPLSSSGSPMLCQARQTEFFPGTAFHTNNSPNIPQGVYDYNSFDSAEPPFNYPPQILYSVSAGHYPWLHNHGFDAQVQPEMVERPLHMDIVEHPFAEWTTCAVSNLEMYPL